MIGKYNIIQKYLSIEGESRITRIQFLIRFFILFVIYLSVILGKLTDSFYSQKDLNRVADILLVIMIYPLFTIFIKRLRDLGINSIFPGISFLLTFGLIIGFFILSRSFDLNYIEGPGESATYSNAFNDLFKFIGLSIYKIVILICGIPLFHYLFNCFIKSGVLNKNKYGSPNTLPISPIG